ncbi:hypothetical protein TNCV_815521 [Trichonephila clavipes]|nr:hypothetical protein TNCV_815521 [Trichonephila clavipes]
MDRALQTGRALCDGERSCSSPTSTTENNVQVVEGIVMNKLCKLGKNMGTKQVRAVKLRPIWTVPKFDEAMLSDPIPGPFSCPSYPLNSSSFLKLLPYINLGQITAAYDSSIVNTKFILSAASFLEEPSPVRTLKTACRNRERRKNVSR